MKPKTFFAVLIFASFGAAAAPHTPAGPGSAGGPDELETAISYFVPNGPERGDLRKAAEGRLGEGAKRIALVVGSDSAAVAPVLRRNVLENLKGKIDLKAEGLGRFPMSAGDILGTVIEYEIFKARSYLTSGVFPKRYFGYFDRKWDTADREEELLLGTRDAVEIVNTRQEEAARPVRLSEIEVLVTWVSEGGALLLRENKHLVADDDARRIDLTNQLGCDNIGLALDRYPELAARLDLALGTDLVGASRKSGKGSTGDMRVGIDRRVTFPESIAGVTLMYLFEKEIAARKLDASAEQEGGWPSAELGDYSPEDQFIISSLVFNTGILFPRSWVESIRSFTTIHRLHALSVKNSEKRGAGWRPPLPVDRSPEAAFERLESKGYRRQPTSWQGSYHILQRYGAMVALRECAGLFDEAGRWSGE